MLKRLLSLALVGLLVHVAAAPAAAGARAEQGAKLAAKVKEGVAALGVGPQARVKVKLRDRAKLEGYVSEAREDYFVVTEAKTGAAVKVPYPQVAQVKGHNLSTKAKVAIGVGIALGVIITIAIINAALDDG
jgi:hypothetical protein